MTTHRRLLLVLPWFVWLAGCHSGNYMTGDDAGEPGDDAGKNPMPDAGTPGDDASHAPIVIGSTPSFGATGVATSTGIGVTFSKPMDSSTTSIALTPALGLGAPVWSAGDTVVAFQPSAPLALGTTYTVMVSGMDATGIALVPMSFTFSTTALPDTTPPTVVATTPANGALEVPQATAISVQFSEPMDPSTVTLAVSASITDVNTVPVAVPTLVPTWSANHTVVTLGNPPALSDGASYLVAINGADLAGNAMAQVSFGFQAFVTPHIASPPPGAFLSFDYYPHFGPVDLGTASNVTLFFTKPMNQAATTAAMSITDLGTDGTGNTPVSCVCAPVGGCTGDGWRWVVDTNPNPDGANYVSCGQFISRTGGTFSPATANGHTYRVTVTNAAQDTEGHPLVFADGGTSFSWQYATKQKTPPTDTTPPTVVSYTPSLNATLQSANPPVPIVVTFSEPMDLASTESAFSTSAGLAGTFAWNADSTVMTFTPAQPWPYATVFANNVTFTIGAGAKDSGGYPTLNSMGTNVTGGFRTPFLDTVTLQPDASANALGWIYADTFVPYNPVTQCGFPQPVNVGLDVDVGAWSNTECDPLFGIIDKEEPSRGFLAYDASALKTVLKVVQATVDLDVGEVDSNPTALGDFQVVPVFTPPSGALAGSSYGETPDSGSIALLPTPSAPGLVRNADITNVVADSLANRASQQNLVELRLQFSVSTVGNPFQNTGYKIHSVSSPLTIRFESDAP